MLLNPGNYNLGPQNAELLVSTARAGAAAKAGHDLTIEVTSWSGTLTVGEDAAATTVALSADGGSLRVRAGTGGMKALSDDDKRNIKQTIDEDVLKAGTIEFRSGKVEAGPGSESLRVEGELELRGTRHPIAFELALVGPDRVTGRATVKQTDWKIKPYSALFGALKVADEVDVTIDVTLALPDSRPLSPRARTPTPVGRAAWNSGPAVRRGSDRPGTTRRSTSIR
ncbi:MAG: YceI family protein [Solirubrobacteraceae bacterium]